MNGGVYLYTCDRMLVYVQAMLNNHYLYTNKKDGSKEVNLEIIYSE